MSYCEDGSSRERLEVVREFQTLTVWWYDAKAEYWYTLNKLKEYTNGERRIYDDMSGDKDWAKRIAKHYGLKLPKPAEDKE